MVALVTWLTLGTLAKFAKSAGVWSGVGCVGAGGVVWMRGVWCGGVGKGVCWDSSADSEPEKY